MTSRRNLFLCCGYHFFIDFRDTHLTLQRNAHVYNISIKTTISSTGILLKLKDHYSFHSISSSSSTFFFAHSISIPQPKRKDPRFIRDAHVILFKGNQNQELSCFYVLNFYGGTFICLQERREKVKLI